MTDPTLEGRLARAQGDDAERRAHNAGQAAATYARECQRLRDRLATIERRVRELADWWDERARNAGHNEGGGKVRECAKDLRALIDGEKEAGDGD